MPFRRLDKDLAMQAFKRKHDELKAKRARGWTPTCPFCGHQRFSVDSYYHTPPIASSGGQSEDEYAGKAAFYIGLNCDDCGLFLPFAASEYGLREAPTEALIQPEESP